MPLMQGCWVRLHQLELDVPNKLDLCVKLLTGHLEWHVNYYFLYCKLLNHVDIIFVKHSLMSHVYMLKIKLEPQGDQLSLAQHKEW